MQSQNNSVNIWQMALMTGAAGVLTFAAYKMMEPEKLADPLECKGHVRQLISQDQMKAIMEDLKIHLTPYYVHYYNILKLQEEEAFETHGSKEQGLKSAVLNEFREKIQDKLDEKRILV